MSPKIVKVVAWIATTVLAIIMLAAGGPKLAGDAAMKEAFIDFGWPDPIFFLTGVAEILAGIGLLVRQFRVAAAAVIGFIMLGAAITNITIGEPSFASFNLILIVTCATLAWYYASLEGLSVKEALLTTGRWKAAPSAE